MGLKYVIKKYMHQFSMPVCNNNGKKSWGHYISVISVSNTILGIFCRVRVKFISLRKKYYKIVKGGGTGRHIKPESRYNEYLP